MKTITKDDVKRAATELAKTGPITTNDVKMKLRAEGFFADQNTVSELIKEIYDEDNGEWSRTFKDNHWEYTKVDPSLGSPSQQLLQANAAATAPTGSAQDQISDAVN